MPTFQYMAMGLDGQRVRGVLAGASEQAVLAELESRRLTPVSINASREPIFRLRRGVSVRRLATAYEQLADLLRAGVPLLRALRLLGGQKQSPRLAEVFTQLSEAVAEGEEFHVAMGRRPEVFRRVHVAMVRAGEKGGFLEDVLARLCELLTGQADLRSKVIGNLVYPGVLVVAGTGILSAIFGVFIPRFRPLFERLGDDLPGVTRFVFAVSTGVSKYGLVTLGVVAALVLTGIVLSRRPAVRRWVTTVRTFAPVVGPLTRALATARLCRLLGTMLRNGVPMLTAMGIAKEASGNVLLEEAVERAREAVRAGEPLAAPLGQSGLFSTDVVEMIAVAEAANNLDSVLTTIAETIERRIERMLTVAVRLIEPLLLMVLASVVVTVALGLILPMARLGSTV